MAALQPLDPPQGQGDSGLKKTRMGWTGSSSWSRALWCCGGPRHPILGKTAMEVGKSVEVLRWLPRREDVGGLLIIVTFCLPSFPSLFFLRARIHHN